MTVFKFPTPPDCPVYDVQGDKWVPKLLFWECVSYPSEPKLPFYEILATYGPLSTLEGAEPVRQGCEYIHGPFVVLGGSQQ